jgi:chromosomal replication initiation ATPase DnaA
MDYRNLKEALQLATIYTQEELTQMILDCKEETVEEMIIGEVEAVTNITTEQLMTKTRKYEIKEARHLTIHFFNKYLSNKSLKDIANYFGMSCHSSVIHSNKQVRNNLFFDDYKARYNKIDNRLNNLFKNMH